VQGLELGTSWVRSLLSMLTTTQPRSKHPDTSIRPLFLPNIYILISSPLIGRVQWYQREKNTSSREVLMDIQRIHKPWRSIYVISKQFVCTNIPSWHPICYAPLKNSFEGRNHLFLSC
jgi:hypothetical protein